MASLSNGVKHATMFTADNLHVLRGMDEECIDLIYLDPPFNSKKQWSAPIGSQAAGASFKDAWTFHDLDEAWLGEIANTNQALADLIDSFGRINGKPDESYLIYMTVRLLEMHRVLKPTGSLYLHCDPVMSHSLKLVIDAIFTEGGGFRNEIVWHYRRWTAGEKNFQRLHDVIFRVTKSEEDTFNLIYEPSANEAKGRNESWIWDDKKQVYYRWQSLSGKRYKIFKNEKGVKIGDVWYIPFLHPSSKERTGYPTQKPLALLERIIKASSNERDWVLDPFAGCATACVAAEELKRKWIGIDLSSKAFDLVKLRFRDYLQLFNPDIHHRTDLPVRSSGIIRTKEDKSILYGRQHGNCLGCMKHFEYRNLEIDHIIPKAVGGQDHVENLQLLCGSCNRIKGTRTMPELKARLKELGISA